MNSFISFIDDLSKWANEVPIDDVSAESSYPIYRKCRTFKDYVCSQNPYRYKRFFHVNDCLYLKFERVDRDFLMASVLLLIHPVKFADIFTKGRFKGFQKQIRNRNLQQDLNDFFKEIKNIQSVNQLCIDFDSICELKLDGLSANEDNLEEVLVDYLRR